MDEQSENVIETLQENYLEALNTGDTEKIKAAESALDGALKGNKPPDPEPEPVAEDTSPESSQEQSDEGSQGSDAQQATQEGEDNKDVAPSAEKETKSDTQNWLDSLDEGVRSEVEKLLKHTQQLEQRIRSDDGRVAAFQRRYEEVRKKAVQQEEQLKKLQSTAQPHGNKPGAAPKNPTLSLEDDPDLKEIAESDEQLARLIRKRDQSHLDTISELRKEIDGLKHQFDPFRERYENDHLASEETRLLQMIPNAREIFSFEDNGVNMWKEWMEHQPPVIRAAAESDNAEEVAWALSKHITDMRRYYGFDQEQPTQEEQKPSVDPSKARSVQQERERKLQAQPVGSASAPPPQKTKPTMQEIVSNPKLLEQEQLRIFNETMKSLGQTA